MNLPRLMQPLAFLLAFALLPAAAASEVWERAQKELRADKFAQSEMERWTRPAYAPIGDGSDDGDPYMVDLVLLEVYEPTFYPDETWIRFACMGTPGVQYRGGFSLLAVQIRARHADGVWDSREDTSSGFEICSIGQGIDTSFAEIPRSLKVKGWSIFVEAEERKDMNVAIGERVFWPITKR